MLVNSRLMRLEIQTRLDGDDDYKAGKRVQDFY